MQPGQPEEIGFLAELGIKIAGFFLSFVGGIVAATWVVANKLNGYDKKFTTTDLRIKATEEFQDKVDAKLDRLHERIDEVLIQGGRHEHRG